MTLSGGGSASDMSGQTVLTAEDVDIDVVGEGDDGLEEKDSDAGCDSPAGPPELRLDEADEVTPAAPHHGPSQPPHQQPLALPKEAAGAGAGPGGEVGASEADGCKGGVGGEEGVLPPAVPLLPSGELGRKAAAFGSQLGPGLQLQLNSLGAAAAAAGTAGAAGTTASLIKSEPSARPSFSIENIIGGGPAAPGGSAAGAGGAGVTGGTGGGGSGGAAQSFLRPPGTVQSAALMATHQPLSLSRTTATIAPILSVPLSGQFLQPAASAAAAAAAAAQAKWPAQ
ncbi:forkhead box protein D3 [Pteropus vampyrus]|uniref:Forkhead box protein D3 n=1 Tax=Pteropus vampyrus TaxID=132908 RepID=A0A6P3QNR9_PTEVA|nr:forkhead box protein D3 [Pteropus vampyrus]